MPNEAENNISIKRKLLNIILALLCFLGGAASMHATFLAVFALMWGGGSAPYDILTYLINTGIPLFIFLIGCSFFYGGITLIKITLGRKNKGKNTFAKMLLICGTFFALLLIILTQETIYNSFSPLLVFSKDEHILIKNVSIDSVPDNLKPGYINALHFLPELPEGVKAKEISSKEFRTKFGSNIANITALPDFSEKLPLVVFEDLSNKVPPEIAKMLDATKISQQIFPKSKYYFFFKNGARQEEYFSNNASPDKDREFSIIQLSNPKEKTEVVIGKSRYISFGKNLQYFLLIKDKKSGAFKPYPLRTFDPRGYDARWILKNIILFTGWHREMVIFDMRTGKAKKIFNNEITGGGIYASPDGKNAIIGFFSDPIYFGDAQDWLYKTLDLINEEGDIKFIAKIKLMEKLSDRDKKKDLFKFMGWSDNDTFYLYARNKYFQISIKNGAKQ